MKITLFGIAEAEGKPEELSIFLTLFFSGLKEVEKINEEQEISSGMAELFKSIDESMKKKGDT